MVGAGVYIIQIDTDAENIHPLQNFQMLNRIFSPYIRGGRYFDFGCNAHRYSVLIWGGYEHDILRGDLSFDIPPYAPQMPPIHVSEDLDKDYHYGLIGIAFKATFFHFLEIKLKYHRKIDLNRDELLNYTSILTNLYLSRKWGVSYRYKYMDEIIGENIYHIGGVVYMF